MPVAPIQELLAFQHDAYALALSKLGSEADAEDAVQEAYLRVLRLGGCPPDSRVLKFWFLKVVLNVLRDRRKGDRRRVAREQRSEQAQRNEAAAMEGEEKNEELCGALSEALKSLDEQLRVAISLHHMQGLTLAQAAEIAGVPEGTLSGHASRGVKALREKLSRMGYALAPAALAELLAQGSGTPAPPALSVALEALCAQSVAGTLPAEETLRATKPFSGAQAVWISAALALPAAWLGWMALGRPAEVKPSAAPVMETTAHEIAAGTENEKAAAPAFLRRWDFNAPEPPADLKVMQGSWKQVPDGGPDGSGCMEITSDIMVLELEIELERFPVRISFQTCPLPPEFPGGFYSSVYWPSNQRVAKFKNIGRLMLIAKGVWVSCVNYAAAEYVDRWGGERRSSLDVYTPTAGARLRIFFRGRQRMDDLKMEALKPGEAPDVSAYLSALEKIPPEKRVGSMVLPELKAVDSSKPVSVQFSEPNEVGEDKAVGK